MPASMTRTGRSLALILLFVLALGSLEVTRQSIGRLMPAIADGGDEGRRVRCKDDGESAESKSTSEGKGTAPTEYSSLGMDFWWLQSLQNSMLSLGNIGGEGGTTNATTNTTTASARNDRRPRLRPFDFNGLPVNRLWIDVGVHQRSDFIPNLEKEGDLFVIGFEPSHLWRPCEHPRCLVLRAACTPTHREVTLNVQDAGGLCDSLLSPNTETTTRIYRGCVTQAKKVKGVPGLPLSEVIRRIPDDITVEYVKIDAQGYDLEVMKGLLSETHRVQVASLEAMDVYNRSMLLYHGQPALWEIKDFLGEAGWSFVESVGFDAGTIGEVDAYFVSDPLYAAKARQLIAKFS